MIQLINLYKLMLSYLIVIIYPRMYWEMSQILPNLPYITNVLYVLAY